MLNKLMKHEMNAVARYLLPLYLCLIVVSIITRFVINFDFFHGALSIIPGFIIFAYIILAIAAIFVTFIMLIIRFYKNLITDEGYLMFTLPVKSSQLINSKLITAILWTIASFAIVLLSVIIVVINPDIIDAARSILKNVLYEIGSTFSGNVAILIIEFVLMFILGLINNILLIYVSIAVGQLFKGHRLISSFVAYMAISTVVQIATTLIFAIFAFVYNTNFIETNSLPQFIFPLTILQLLILNIIYYCVTKYLFTNKLNLE